jgi:uncharacterized protein YbjQ (UPF0145 family)
MIVTNTSEIPGKKINKILGIVKGTTVRSKHIGKDIGAGLKSIIGGEIKSYTDMLSQAREEAYNRMVNEAIKLDADAIINVRFMTSAITQAAAELLVYGTAVKLK